VTRTEILEILSRRMASPEITGVASAYLFGSFAEERMHAESDVDVGLLLDRGAFPGARERFEQRVLLGSRLGGSLGGRTLDVVVLNDAPPLFARAIVTRGRRFHCADPEADHAFVRDAQIRAADLEPFLRRMRQIKLEALKRP
jgi:predicted nucleotidyltransferase